MRSKKPTILHLVKAIVEISAVMSLILSSMVVTAARPDVALVLGGETAIGFSHIGIIRALEESGIPIDILVGTSMGRILAGLYSSGYSTDNTAQIFGSIDTNTLFSLPIPAVEAFSAEKDCTLLYELLEEQTFPQLKRPCYAVITELSTGEEIALHEGGRQR